MQHTRTKRRQDRAISALTMARWPAGRCDHRLRATAPAALWWSIREQGGASRGAGRSMNCTSGLAVVSHRGGGASPGACELDTPAFDRPRSTSGVACPSGSRVPARHRSRMGLAAWSRCMTARSTSGDSPNHGPTLAIFDRSVRNWGTRTQRIAQRRPAAKKSRGRGCPGGVFPVQRAWLHLLNLSDWPMLRSVAPQCYPRAARASRAVFSS